MIRVTSVIELVAEEYGTQILIYNVDDRFFCNLSEDLRKWQRIEMFSLEKKVVE